MQNRISIVLAHSVDLYLIGARHILAEDPDCQVIASTSRLSELIYALHQHRPAVVLVNEHFSPDATTFQMIESIHSSVPEARVIISGRMTDGLFVRDLLHAGAAGYLCEGDALAECLRPAIYTVLRDRPYLSPTPNAEYLVAMQSPLRDWHLDQEARSVLHMLAQGKRACEIASALGVDTRRIYRVRQKLRARFGADTNEQLIAIAAGEGFLIFNLSDRI
jgi:DNA-binding NarL/FixJ family response regulator